MAFTKEELDALCDNIVDLEGKKAALTAAIKESKELFAANKELTKKSVNDFVKKWKEANKDKEEYTLVDYETEAMILVAFPELGTTDADTLND